MLRKSLALLLLALGCVTVWWRDGARPEPQTPTVAAIPATAPGFAPDGPLELRGLWRLTSAEREFGGFSAMILREPGGMRLFTDYGSLIDLPRPGAEGYDYSAALRRAGRETMRKRDRDIEAATAFGGKIWLGYERANAIVRYDAQMRLEKRVAPEVLSGWGATSGPESLARLADGRFLALREGPKWAFDESPIEAVLFRADPVEGARGEAVTIVGNGAYRPVDAATTPSGDVLVLLRGLRIGLPVRFESRIALLRRDDLADKRARLVLLAQIDGPLPADNYEGIAVRANGNEWEIWLVSDDNDSHFQANWLARLSLDPARLPN